MMHGGGGEGVLELESGAAAAATAGDGDASESRAMYVLRVYAPWATLLVAAFVGLFVLLRRWSYSPTYLIFTWQ